MTAKECWVMLVELDEDVSKALTLCEALRRSLTKKAICVIMKTCVSDKMRMLLMEAFDYVLDGIPKAELWRSSDNSPPSVVLSTISMWKLLSLFSKAVFLQLNSIVLMNCDDLFDLHDGEFVAASSRDTSGEQKFDSCVFTFKPNYWTFQDMIHTVATQHRIETVNQMLNMYFGQCRSAKALMCDRKYNEIVGIDLTSTTELIQNKKMICFTSDDAEMRFRAENQVEHHERLYRGQFKSTECKMRDELAAVADSVAIIGLSCRFAGANNADEFWDILFEGKDETKPFPVERYFTVKDPSSVPNITGYLKCPIDEFDAKFFHISRREAEFMDPQQRLLMELSWEALENAGINPHSLHGTNTSTMVGLWSQEYVAFMNRSYDDDFMFKYFGNAICAASARISNFLQLNGPSITFESGCSSALEGLHHGCELLRSKKTNLVISGGVNLDLISNDSMNVVHASDGKCKTFDEAADGYARGEACAILILKRTADAVRDNDNILGIIRASSLNSSAGAGLTLGIPSSVCQALVINDAIARANINRNEVSYIEAHGTGTPAGDPVEFNGLNAVFGSRESRREDSPLIVGSVKTNIGHTESASGLAGLIKVLLIMKHKIIPKHLHFNKINPYINLDIIPAIIPLENIMLDSSSKIGQNGLICGVSSFGMSGTNVHVIIQEPPTQTQLTYPLCNNKLERSTHLFLLSAKSEDALNDLKNKYISFLELNKFSNGGMDLPDLAYIVNTTRAQLRYRLAIIAKDTTELITNLKKGYNSITGVTSNTLTERVQCPKIVFLYTGQGSQYLNMGESLYKSHPYFKSCFDKCSNLLKNNYGLDLISILHYNTNESIKNYRREDKDKLLSLDNSLYSQPALFCIGYCLSELWRSFGFEPDIVLGHSVGEFSAAVTAGIISLEDGLKLVVERSRLVNSLEKGCMMVIKASIEIVQSLLIEFQKNLRDYVEEEVFTNFWIDIAAINSNFETVVSGSGSSIDAFALYCLKHSLNIKSQKLNASHAFHSRSMNPILVEYESIASSAKILKRKENKMKKIEFVSGTRAKLMKSNEFDSNYWVDHLRSSVQFSSAFKLLLDTVHGKLENIEEGKDSSNNDKIIFIEIGPQPILTSLGMSLVPSSTTLNYVYCPSIRKNEDNWVTILTSLSKCFTHSNSSIELDWKQIDLYYKRNNKLDNNNVQLPNYPFQREKYWFNLNNGVDNGNDNDDGIENNLDINCKLLHPILGRRVPLSKSDIIIYHNSITLESLQWSKDHKISDYYVLPAAAFIDCILAAGRDILFGGGNNNNINNVPLTIKDLIVVAPVQLKQNQSVQIQTIVQVKSQLLSGHDKDDKIVVEDRKDNKDSSNSNEIEYDITIYKQIVYNTNGSDSGKWKKIVSATFLPIVSSDDNDDMSRIDDTTNLNNLQYLKSNLNPNVNVDDFYLQCNENGLNFGELFQSIKSGWYSNKEVLVETILPAKNEEYLVHPILLDCMMQTVGITSFVHESQPVGTKDEDINFDFKKSNPGMLLPASIEKFSCVQKQYTEQLYIHIQGYNINDESSSNPEKDHRKSVIAKMYNNAGEHLASMIGLELVETTTETFIRSISSGLDKYPGFYDDIWQPDDVEFSSNLFRANLPNLVENKLIRRQEGINNSTDQIDKLILNQLDKLCYLYILKAFTTISNGWELGPLNTIISISEFMNQNEILKEHHKLMVRFFKILEEEGDVIFLSQYNCWNKVEVEAETLGTVKIIKNCLNLDCIDAEIIKLISWFKKTEIACDMIEYRFIIDCGANLVDLLLGKASPYDTLIIPEESSSFIGSVGLYRSQNSLLSKLHEQEMQLFNSILNQFIFLNNNEGNINQEPFKLRILEIGGGSGNMTELITTALELSNTPYEYTFTEFCPVMLGLAKERWENHKYISCKRLDIQNDPKSQGFIPCHYDIVIADFVLTITTNISETLSNVRHLMVPKGLLFISDVFKQFRMYDISFGMYTSWWRFNDFELRSDYPIIDFKSWASLLKLNDFSIPNENEGIIQLFDDRLGFMLAQAGNIKLTCPLVSTVGVSDNNNTTGYWLLFIRDNSRPCKNNSDDDDDDDDDDQKFIKQLIFKLKIVGRKPILVTLSKNNNVEGVGVNDDTTTFRQLTTDHFNVVVNNNSQNFIQLIQHIQTIYNIKEFDNILYLYGLCLPFHNDKNNQTVNNKIGGLLDNNTLIMNDNEMKDFEYSDYVSVLCGGLLHLVQALHSLHIPMNIFNITRQAQLITIKDSCSISEFQCNPIGSISWGLMLSCCNEFYGSLGKKFVSIDIDWEDEKEEVQNKLHGFINGNNNGSIERAVSSVFNELWCKDNGDYEIGLRNDTKWVKRFIKVDKYRPSLTLPNVERYKLNNPSSGLFSDFLIMTAPVLSMKSFEVEVAIKCTALHFKDVLMAMNSKDMEQVGAAKVDQPLGMDFAGFITKLGSDVIHSKEYKVGDAVIGMTDNGSLASHVVIPSRNIYLKPKVLPFEDAATVTGCYGSAGYFLGYDGKLKSNDKVLIHVASGGVGLAAVNIAKSIGAIIFATAGSKRKRTFLREQYGLKYVYNSRTIDYGKEILRDTNGYGVDVILNSLTGPGFKETNLSICAPNAKWLEMSVLNTWSKSDLNALRPDILYSTRGIDTINALISSKDLDRLESDNSISREGYDETKKFVASIFDSGVYPTLPFTRFTLNRVEDAFHYLQQAKQVGKVVVTNPTTSLNPSTGLVEHKFKLFNEYSSYVITGGLGGLGMEVAKWMSKSGAKYLILVGRNPPSSTVEPIISKLKSDGIQLLILQLDVSNYKDCQNILIEIEKHQFPKLKGIIHSAGVLSDQIIINLNLDSFYKVFKSKLAGTLNLHNLTKNLQLEHFVLFSSVTSLFGGLGQANHCAANKYLDEFSKWRVSQGLPSICINWGAWSDVGVAANVKSLEKITGIKKFSPNQGIFALERAMLSHYSNTIILEDSDWNIITRAYHRGNYFNLIKKDSKLDDVRNLEMSKSIKIIKETNDPNEQLNLIKDFLEYIVRDILRIRSTELVDHDQDLRELGIDSLMGMELKTRLQPLLDSNTKPMSMNQFIQNRTINKLSLVIAQLINNSSSSSSSELQDSEQLLALIKKDSILPSDITIPFQQEFKDDSSSLTQSSRTNIIMYPPSKIQTILLTGSTGHLGSYILQELIDFSNQKQTDNNDTDTDSSLKIYCLVRANSDLEAKERLENVLEDYNLLLDPPTNFSCNNDKVDELKYDNVLTNYNNIICIHGDVSKPNLGIDNPSFYNKLIEEVDGVIHCAVLADHVLPYYSSSSSNGEDDDDDDQYSIRNNNVIGLLNILRFTVQGKVKHLQCHSAITCLTHLELNQDDETLAEQFPEDDDFGQNLKLSGYLISKFICEKLIKQSLERGIPIVTLRHHLLLGDSKTGLIPMNKNHLVKFMWTCKSIGKVPKMHNDMNITLTIIAIDIAAKISVLLFMPTSSPVHSQALTHNTNNKNSSLPSSSPETGTTITTPGIYNINNPKVIKINDLFSLFNERNYKYEVIDYNEWRSFVFQEDSIESSERTELSPFAEIYTKDFLTNGLGFQVPIIKALTLDQICYKNSIKLKSFIPNIDELMIEPSKLIELHLETYEAMIGKENLMIN